MTWFDWCRGWKSENKETTRDFDEDGNIRNLILGNNQRAGWLNTKIAIFGSNLEMADVKDFIIALSKTPVGADALLCRLPGEFRILGQENKWNSELVPELESQEDQHRMIHEDEGDHGSDEPDEVQEQLKLPIIKMIRRVKDTPMEAEVDFSGAPLLRTF